MDHHNFYKEQYQGTLIHKNEINNSLSTPIGILTALIAGFFYTLTNFDFTDNKYLSFVFILIAIVSLLILGKSIHFLIRSFSDFHNGFNYAYLPDADTLKQYYDGLVAHYDSHSNSIREESLEKANSDFNEYLIDVYYKSAGINQRNNEAKISYRFQCHGYIIYTLISLSLLIVPFGIGFVLNKGKDQIEKIKIISPIPVKLDLKVQLKDGKSTKQTDYGKATTSQTDTSANKNGKRGSKSEYQSTKK